MITYCVICREREVSFTRRAPLIRFYLSSAAADRAILITEAENPQYRVLGIEPVARDDCKPPRPFLYGFGWLCLSRTSRLCMREFKHVEARFEGLEDRVIGSTA
jgi:hypothetical protein